ncbi:MAG TPA: pilus assembly protein [Propionicimonas sp.]|jgi:Flp pilus assembly protein TadG
MTHLTERLRADPDQGSVTVFFAISVLGLLLLLGLVADGGAKLRATQRATATAAEAARVGGQALDTAQAAAGDTGHVDPTLAVQAARDYLTAARATGSVTVSPDRTRLTVTVTSTTPTAFLSLIGIDQLSVTAHAQAVLVGAITGGGT